MSTYEKRMRETQVEHASMRRRSVVQMSSSSTVEMWPKAKQARKTMRNALEDTDGSLGAKIFRWSTTSLIIASVLVLCLQVRPRAPARARYPHSSRGRGALRYAVADTRRA